MELKALILGLVFTLGIFAFKGGAGLSYFIRSQKSMLSIILGMLIHAALYGFLTLGCWFLLNKINLLNHLGFITTVSTGSMTVHGIFALLLFIWGAYLLTTSSDQHDGSYGWLLLVIPCPVCLLVFICSTALLHSFFPEKTEVLVLLYAGFITLSYTVALLFIFLFRAFQPEKVLGNTMLFCALYFLLTVVMVPQFSQIERIYRLCSGRAALPQHYGELFGAAAILLIIGFMLQLKREIWK